MLSPVGGAAQCGGANTTGLVSTVKIEKLEAKKLIKQFENLGDSNPTTCLMYGVKAHWRKLMGH